jgi:hypothetical protein
MARLGQAIRGGHKLKCPGFFNEWEEKNCHKKSFENFSFVTNILLVSEFG